MQRCPECGRAVQSGVDNCPDCRAELPDGADGAWVPVARLSNLAEAGFFADILRHDQIDARVGQHDRFSAVDGSWTADFFLQVPAAEADRAAERLQAHLSATTEQNRDNPAEHEMLANRDLAARVQGFDEEPSAGVPWRPLVVLLVAGGIVYLSGRAFLDGQQGRANRRGATLWETLAEIEGPLESPARPGRSGFRLHYDRILDRAYLEKDVDGDGQFDVTLEFKDGELVTAGGQPRP